jgi:crotonobetainyl-CoA:carnitine CoA-transferase CaiB-like acyl-CoA transferase
MSDSDLPLKGVRVLDLGIITAGAATSALLADLGADVIKVEAPNYIDPFRVWVDIEKKDDWWNASPYFNFTNRNKRSLCLDLKKEAGRDLFLRLVAVSDVLVENFRRGVMDRLGLGVGTLHKTNPRLIVAAISSQGETGPDRDVSSFGSTLEATSGMAHLTGPVDGPPVLTGRDLNYPDQVVALFAAGMVAAALHARRNAGSGIHLDISQRELTSFLLGEKFLSDGSVPDREGNADACVAQQMIRRAADGAWIAVTDSENAGVAQSAVLDGEAIRHAHWFSRSLAFAETSEGALVKGFPFQFRETPMRIARPAPRLGQDTAYVLGELLGLGTSDLATLIDAGVIGDKPSYGA